MAGELELETALGRLLSDPDARAAHRADPEAWCAAAGGASSAREVLCELDPDELAVQAQVLLDKRRGEVVERIPRTAARLGDELAPLFQRYAPATWPRGHLRHLHDALGFLRFLQREAPAAPHSLDEAFLEADLARREGRRFAAGVAHHRDLPLSCAYLAWRGPRGRLRVLLPLPWPSAFGRRLRWR